MKSFLAKLSQTKLMPFAIGVALYVFFLAVSIVYLHDQGKANVQRQLTSAAFLKATDVEEWLRRHQTQLLQPESGYLASMLSELQKQSPVAGQLTEYRKRLFVYQQRNLEIAQIELYNLHEQRLLSLFDSDSQPLKPLWPHVTAKQQGAELTGSELCSLPQGQRCYSIIAPLFEKLPTGTKPLGYAVFTIDLERILIPSLAKWYGSNDAAQFFLYRSGEVFSTASKTEASKSLSAFPNSAQILQNLVPDVQPGRLLEFDFGTKASLAVVQPVTGKPWFVVAVIERSEALADTRKDILTLGFFELLLLLIAFAIAWYWMRTQSAKFLLIETKKEQQLFQSFIDHIPGIAFIKDREGRVLMANPGFCREFGISRESVLGKTNQEVFPGEVGKEFDRVDLRIFASGQAELIEEDIAGRIYQTSKFVMSDRQGNKMLGGIALDVSLRERNARRAQALLQINELATSLDEKALLNHGLEAAQKLTGSEIGFLHFVNEDQESIELVTWTAGALKGCTAAFDSHYPLSQAGIWADCARQMQPVVFNDYASYQKKRGLPEGHAKLDRLISVPVIENGKIRMMTGVGNRNSDYSDWDVETLQLIGNQLWLHVRRSRVEAALSKAVQVIEASPIVCFRWLAEPQWPVDYVSANVSRWGYRVDDLKAGKPSFAELVHPDDLARVVAEVSAYNAAGQDSFVQEYRLRTADGQLIWVEDVTSVERDENAQVLAYNGLLSDIDERKSMQEKLNLQIESLRCLNKKLEEAQAQLLQSEKLAAIGQLAAGVAHELNNPIGFVHSNLGTLTDYVRTLTAICDACPSDSAAALQCPHLEDIQRIKIDEDYGYLRQDIYSLLDESRDGLQRVRKIVQDLRDFSRSGSQAWEWANLHIGLESTLNIVGNELKYKCTVIKEFGDLPEVYCVLSQLNQVFMNLLVNAVQAIEGKGEIVLRTGRENEEHVWITISDTGQGISPENMKRIFEPFFTTKPVGQGTGLGLSLVYGIIEKHRGKISVDSEIGRGTTFRIVLPIHSPDVGNSQEENRA